MARRDTELAAFVDARGAALMRTASLLAPDDAEPVLAAALARTAGSWREASRDDDVERFARGELYRSAVLRWRKDRGLDVDDAGKPADDDLADRDPARKALRELTRRERAVLVLTTYEGLDADEVGAVLRMRTDAVPATLELARRRLRERLPGRSTDQALRDAASGDVPPTLLPTVLADTRRSLRLRLGVGAVAVAALVVVAAVALRPVPATPPAADASLSEWGLPRALPPANDLPDLGEQPITAASAAYLADGIPVVVDAETGAASTVFRGAPSPEWFDGEVDKGTPALLGSAGRWTDLALSPDGTRLALVQTRRPYFDGELSRRVYLVDLEAAALTPVRGLSPVNREGRYARLEGAALAWAPSSDAFACACDGSLSVVRLDEGAPRVTATSWPATDVAWGGIGVAAQSDTGEWALIDAGGDLRLDTLSFGDVLSMSATRPPQYLTATTGSTFSLAGDTKPDGARCVLWDANIANPVSVTPIPDRDGPFCTPVLVQPGRSAFVMVIRSTLPRPQPASLDVVVVGMDGDSGRISVLPPGTGAASFAGDLVG